jgi:hypothetical protein
MKKSFFLFPFLILLVGCPHPAPPVQPTAPPVTVVPSATTITQNQVLSITVNVSGTPTPTGSITVSSGTAYTSIGSILANGTATVTVPSNTLAVGSYPFLADYTPDLNSSSTYTFSSGTSLPVVVTAASTSGIVVPWNLPDGCTPTQPCNFWIYRIVGPCPTTLANSPGWTLLATVSQQITYTDTTVVSGTEYSYDVESGVGIIPTSGPDDCASFTAP